MGLNPELVKMALHRVKRADLGGTDQLYDAAPSSSDMQRPWAPHRVTKKPRPDQAGLSPEEVDMLASSGGPPPVPQTRTPTPMPTSPPDPTHSFLGQLEEGKATIPGPQQAGAGAGAFEDLATQPPVTGAGDAVNRETTKRRVRHNLEEPSTSAAAPTPAVAPTPTSVPEPAGVAVNREIPQRIRRYGPTQTAEKLIPPKIDMEALHIPGEPGLLRQGWNLARRYPGRAGLIGAGLLAGGYGLGRYLSGGGEPKTACDRLWEVLHRRKQAGAVILPLPVRW